jgi:G:T-mismatch repair DNA endonuclease (very short patch repair protein)
MRVDVVWQCELKNELQVTEKLRRLVDGKE